MSNIGTTFKRATGSGSLHKNDWLNLGLMAAAGTAGAGAAGYGPMSGLLSGGSAAASNAVPWVDTLGDATSGLGAGGLGGWTSGMDLAGGGDLSTLAKAGNLAKQYGPGLLKAANVANSFPQQPTMPGMQRPQQGPAAPSLAYPGLNMPPVNSAGSTPSIGGLDMSNPAIAQAFQEWLKQRQGAFV